jgi:asparagine synthase (glutamine-hydrolysing)
MYRYIALVWAAHDPDATADAHRFRSRLLAQWADASEVLDEKGVMAFVPSAHARSWQTLAQPGCGVIFGRVFRNGRESAASAPTDQEWASIAASGGQYLLENWWGRYVALFRAGSGTDEGGALVNECSRGGSGVSILRDPSSGLPCHIARHGRVWVVFSDLSVCRSLLSLSVNWQYVAGFLKTGRGPASQTGLAEVTELQPGELVTLRRDGLRRRKLWAPIETAISRPIEDAATAIREVRATLERCVHAWASLHPSIVHLLSGGLDSSVVLSCLANAPSRPSLVSLHVVSTVAEEEERYYARTAAKGTGCELRELSIVTNGADLSKWLPGLRAGVKPISTIYEALAGAMSTGLASEVGATAITSGVAGDSLFFQPAAEFAAADFIARHGFRPRLAGVAWDAARLSGSTVWSILRHAISRRPLNPHLQRYADDLEQSGTRATALDRAPGGACDATLLDRERLSHAGARAARRVPPGLPVQLDGMSASVPFYSHFESAAREPDRCPVLLSQPLMELCLRIPSHVWISGGCDRSIVRQAFADRVPSAIWQRTAKGSADAFYGQLVEFNAAFIRETLAGGMLAQQAWLEPDWIDAQLSSRQLRGLEHDRLLHRYLCTEFWVRQYHPADSSVG